MQIKKEKIRDRKKLKITFKSFWANSLIVFAEEITVIERGDMIDFIVENYYRYGFKRRSATIHITKSEIIGYAVIKL